MPKTPPPPLRRSGEEPPEESKSAMSKIGQNIKGRLGDIQTKPDIFGKIRNYRFGEIQTKPDWMKRSPKQQSVAPEHIEWIRIIPIAGQKYVTSKFPSKLGSIEGVVHFRFYKDPKSKIHIYAGHTSVDGLRKALRQRVPNTDLQQTDSPPSFDEKIVRRSGDLGGTLNEKGELEAILDALEDETYLDIAFENCPEQQFKQPLRQFVQGGGEGTPSESSGMMDNFKAFNEAFNPFAESRYSEGGEKTVRGKPKSEMSTEQKDQLKRVEHLLGEHSNYFHVTIKIGTKNANHVQPIFSELSTQLKQQHRFSIEAGGKRGKGRGKTKTDVLWREEELGALVTLPDMTNDQMLRSVTHIKPGERTLGDDELLEGVAVGRLIHPVKAPRLVKIPTNQFLKHFFIGGKNGSGKSSTAVQMIQSLLDEWGADPDSASGFTYVDPAGSTVTNIMNRLLHMEQQGIRIPWEKIHYLDLTPESEYPVGLNLLYHTGGEDYASVAGNVLDVIKSAYGSDAVFTERLLENGAMTLLYDKRVEHTILGLISVLQYSDLREGIQIADPLVREFWDMTGEDLKAKSLDPLLNRLRPLLQKPAMRRIFGQTRWALNIREWMDGGHIILINTLNLESKNVGLVGGQILTRYHITAKNRPADISKPHILMIDEAHLVQVPILDKVIAEDRKFGLSLGLITQYPEQFEGLLLKSISENMGTFFTCTLGPSSAGVVSKMMNGAFDTKTLQGLPTNRVATYTSIEDEAFSFMVKSDPPVIYMPNGKAALYKNASQMVEAQNWAIEKARQLAARDGAHRDDVDQEIASYMDFLRSFREAEESKPSNVSVGGPKQGYKPTLEEISILDVLVSLVKDRREWEGRTSELLATIEGHLSEDKDSLEDWTSKDLGSLISRARPWLEGHGIIADNNHGRSGSIWTMTLK